MKIIASLPFCSLILIGVIAGRLGGSGPITPDEPPGETMKTLDEVEPRIPVNLTNTPGDADASFRITEPGSYYLPRNYTGVSGKHGIKIETDGVVLDLSGFSLIGVAGSLNGINVDSVFGVTIRNGVVRGWGGWGISASGAESTRLEDLAIRFCDGPGLGLADHSNVMRCRVDSCDSGIIGGRGCSYVDCNLSRTLKWGILTQENSTVVRCVLSDNFGIGAQVSGGVLRDCDASGNGDFGFQVGSILPDRGVVMENCRASHNGDWGIEVIGGGTLRGCLAEDNGGGGIRAGSKSNLQACRARQNSVNGIELKSDSSAIECVSEENTFDGFHCFDGAAVLRCRAIRNQRDGIRAVNSDVAIRENHAHHNAQIGIHVNGAGCLVLENYSSTNGTNYSLGGTSVFAPIINSATMITNTNPSVNYEGL